MNSAMIVRMSMSVRMHRISLRLSLIRLVRVIGSL